jgi:hypothetical protein
MRVPDQSPSRIPPGMWRVAIGKAPVSKCARIFAVRVLLPMMTRAGKVRPEGQAGLASRYAAERDRTSITGRRVRQLLAELRGAGLLDRLGRPAPGRPGTYTVLLPGTDLPRPMIVRPRGIAPRRLHASMVAELHETGPP